MSWSEFPCVYLEKKPRPDGYVQIRVEGKLVYAHRHAYETFYKVKLPAGSKRQIDHLCRHRACVQPRHLELVTAQVNTIRAIGREVCGRGHAKAIGVKCKKCKRITARERRAKYGRRDRGAEYPDLRRKRAG